MKKLFYIANIRFPTEKAHGIQIAQMCRAFALLGCEVELIVPNRRTHIKEDPFVFYHLEKNFKIRRLPTLDTVNWGKVGFWIQSVSFILASSIYTLRKSGIFFTRDEIIAASLLLAGKRPIWEAHMGQKNVLTRLLVARKVPIVVISKGLQDLYAGMGVHKDLLLVAPDGVDVDQFNIKQTREEARKDLGLALEEKIVLYTGHLYSWKGADTLAEAAKQLTDATVIFVGGTEKDLTSFKTRYGAVPNIKLLGSKPHHLIPLYMRAADVLVIPNSGKEDISRLYTSPMKLFEYMASGTPIVASDLPSLREILNESTAYFFTPDDQDSLTEVVTCALSDRDMAAVKARRALEEVKKYSWKERALNMLDFIL